MLKMVQEVRGQRSGIACKRLTKRRIDIVVFCFAPDSNGNIVSVLVRRKSISAVSIADYYLNCGCDLYSQHSSECIYTSTCRKRSEKSICIKLLELTNKNAIVIKMVNIISYGFSILSSLFVSTCVELRLHAVKYILALSPI